MSHQKKYQKNTLLKEKILMEIYIIGQKEYYGLEEGQPHTKQK